MGTSRTFGQLSGKLVGFSAVLPTANGRAIGKAALALTQSARASIAAGSGGDSYLSNVGSGARVGARYDVQSSGDTATAVVRGTGALHLLDNPTGPHRITAKLSKGRSQASRAAFYNALFGGGSGYGSARPLRTPYGPRYSVMHPGTRGKRTFWRGIEAAIPRATAVFQQQHQSEMRRYWS